MSAHRTQGRIFWASCLSAWGPFPFGPDGPVGFRRPRRALLAGHLHHHRSLHSPQQQLQERRLRDLLHPFRHVLPPAPDADLRPGGLALHLALAIIATGLWMLLRPAWHPNRSEASEVGGDDLSISQVFSGSARKIESQNFRGGKADVVFGSAEIDLRAARLAGGQAVLVLSAVFGGIEVYVPRDWQIVLEGRPSSARSRATRRPGPSPDANPDHQGIGRVRLDRGQGVSRP